MKKEVNFKKNARGEKIFLDTTRLISPPPSDGNVQLLIINLQPRSQGPLSSSLEKVLSRGRKREDPGNEVDKPSFFLNFQAP